MSDTEDIRWRQRFDQFVRALAWLREAADLAAERPLSELEQEGLIQRFEYTFELAWKVVRDYMEHLGNEDVTGPRSAFRLGVRSKVLGDEQVWIDMVNARNLTSHTYDQDVVAGIARDVLDRFLPAFNELAARFSALAGDKGAP